MQAVRSSGSKIEKTLGRALWSRGLRYRKNDKTVYGKPDFTFKKYKVAVFCDSEFWHGKNWELKKHEHKSNISFWHRKIERNRERDREVNRHLEQEGWTVLRFWGQEIERDLINCAIKTENVLRERRRKSPPRFSEPGSSKEKKEKKK